VIDDASDPEACFAELYDHFARPEHWRLFDDVAPTLERLQRRGLRCALASNFDRRLHGICRGRPELQSIERIVVSTDVGVCKPSSRFYSALLDACDCRPDEVLMIGDDDEADVLGPKRLGISAILIDRHGQAAAPNSIRSLTELPFLEGRP
jgi:putative hydrolase of the HAD superfamily